MKKLIAIVLILVTLCACAATALAMTNEERADNDFMGIPDDFKPSARGLGHNYTFIFMTMKYKTDRVHAYMLQLENAHNAKRKGDMKTYNAVRDQWYNELELDFDEAEQVYWGD